MATTIGSKGAELDLLIRQGATLGPYPARLVNPDTSPMDLTGCTLRAQVRKTYSTDLQTGASAVFTIVNALDGRFTWKIPATSTRELAAGPTELHKDSLYVWDMEIEDSQGDVTPLLYGVVKVFREVTKEV